MAWHVKRLTGVCADVEDLVADGMVGLVTAARRFDRHRGVPFPRFAIPHVRGAIIDGLRRNAPLSRADWRLTHDPIKHVELFAELLPAPSDPERDAIRAETYRRVLRGLSTLGRREQRFVELYYVRGRTLASTGARLGITKSWACRVKARAVAHVAHAVKAA